MSALVELKSGVGGAESSLFVEDLLRAYERVAHEYGWKASLMSSSPLDQGGLRDAILEVQDERAYDLMRWESGVHRVQRVPQTESSGRIHTSTVTVMVRRFFMSDQPPFSPSCKVLPLSEDHGQSEKDDLFSTDEVRIEVMRARGAGGQVRTRIALSHRPNI